MLMLVWCEQGESEVPGIFPPVGGKPWEGNSNMPQRDYNQNYKFILRENNPIS